jgi:hypothetical protein
MEPITPIKIATDINFNASNKISIKTIEPISNTYFFHDFLEENLLEKKKTKAQKDVL